MRLVAIGKAGGKTPEMEIFARYAKRIKPGLALVELADGVGSAAEIKRREAEALLAVLKPDEFLVALDQGGMAPDSLAFSRILAGWQGLGKNLVFAIGGAEGLDGAVLARAGAALSLGELTWPHMLVRVMLAEQIYRAQMILAGHPYHRAGRP